MVGLLPGEKQHNGKLREGEFIMQRHYYISDDLNALDGAERALEAAGIATQQIHVLSNDDAGVELRHLHEVEAVLKKDVVHGTERGAMIGAAGAAAVLLLFWFTGLAEHYTWVPAIFLAVVVLGFCTWEGGLIGIQEPHVDFRRFQDELRQGRHILFVDVGPAQENLLRRVISEQRGLKPAGQGESAPGWVINARRKWSRFVELAP
jgi:hypothetical protein